MYGGVGWSVGYCNAREVAVISSEAHKIATYLRLLNFRHFFTQALKFPRANFFSFSVKIGFFGVLNSKFCWDLVAHPVTQAIGEQALVDILDLSEFSWTCWSVSTPSSGLGLRMVKELDLQLALGMNERR